MWAGGLEVCVWGGWGGILKTYFREEKKSPLQLRMCVCVRIYTFSCSAVCVCVCGGGGGYTENIFSRKKNHLCNCVCAFVFVFTLFRAVLL